MQLFATCIRVIPSRSRSHLQVKGKKVNKSGGGRHTFLCQKQPLVVLAFVDISYINFMKCCMIIPAGIIPILQPSRKYIFIHD